MRSRVNLVTWTTSKIKCIVGGIEMAVDWVSKEVDVRRKRMMRFRDVCMCVCVCVCCSRYKMVVLVRHQLSSFRFLFAGTGSTIGVREE